MGCNGGGGGCGGGGGGGGCGCGVGPGNGEGWAPPCGASWSTCGGGWGGCSGFGGWAGNNCGWGGCGNNYSAPVSLPLPWPVPMMPQPQVPFVAQGARTAFPGMPFPGMPITGGYVDNLRNAFTAFRGGAAPAALTLRGEASSPPSSFAAAPLSAVAPPAAAMAREALRRAAVAAGHGLLTLPPDALSKLGSTLDSVRAKVASVMSGDAATAWPAPAPPQPPVQLPSSSFEASSPPSASAICANGMCIVRELGALNDAANQHAGVAQIPNSAPLEVLGDMIGTIVLEGTPVGPRRWTHVRFCGADGSIVEGWMLPENLSPVTGTNYSSPQGGASWQPGTGKGILPGTQYSPRTRRPPARPIKVTGKPRQPINPIFARLVPGFTLPRTGADPSVGTINAQDVIVRMGPNENAPEIGRLQLGARVNFIGPRTPSTPAAPLGWQGILPPGGGGGYVAAQFVTLDVGGTLPAPAPRSPLQRALENLAHARNMPGITSAVLGALEAVVRNLGGTVPPNTSSVSHQAPVDANSPVMDSHGRYIHQGGAPRQYERTVGLPPPTSRIPFGNFDASQLGTSSPGGFVHPVAGTHATVNATVGVPAGVQPGLKLRPAPRPGGPVTIGPDLPNGTPFVVAQSNILEEGKTANDKERWWLVLTGDGRKGYVRAIGPGNPGGPYVWNVIFPGQQTATGHWNGAGTGQVATAWPYPLTTALSFPNVGSLVTNEDAVRVVNYPRSISRIGWTDVYKSVPDYAFGAISRAAGHGIRIVAWDLSVHRINGSTLEGGIVGYLLKDGLYVKEGGDPISVAVDRNDVVRAWRGGGQEIGNLFAPIPIAIPAPTPQPPPREIKITGKPRDGSGQPSAPPPHRPQDGHLPASLADTFRHQLALAIQRGDEPESARIRHILVMQGAQPGPPMAGPGPSPSTGAVPYTGCACAAAGIAPPSTSCASCQGPNVVGAPGAKLARVETHQAQGLTLRARPTTSSELLGNVANGATVELLSGDVAEATNADPSRWLLVREPTGKTGYVLFIDPQHHWNLAIL